jgi:hypothetical protein
MSNLKLTPALKLMVHCVKSSEMNCLKILKLMGYRVKNLYIIHCFNTGSALFGL